MSMQSCYTNYFMKQQMLQSMLQFGNLPFSGYCNCCARPNFNFGNVPLYTLNFPHIRPISLPQHFNFYSPGVIDNPFGKFMDHPNYQAGNYFPLSNALYLPQLTCNYYNRGNYRVEQQKLLNDFATLVNMFNQITKIEAELSKQTNTTTNRNDNLDIFDDYLTN